MQRATPPDGAWLVIGAAGAQAAWLGATVALVQRASMRVRPDASVTATQVQTGAPVIGCLLM